MSNELTKIGVDNLLERIEQHMIKLPEGTMTAKELECWVNGYFTAQKTIMQLIVEFTGAQYEF